MQHLISAIVCAHNPRKDHLELTLNALRAQTLPADRWELLIVDNCSSPSIPNGIASEWHPNGRVIAEAQLGLTFARLRGIAEARSPLLVFVDVDCVLAPEYLEVALRIASEHPDLGVWSGRVELEFELPPPEWANQFRPSLAERLVEHDEIASGATLAEPLPVGAGLCVRSEAARHYTRQVLGNPLQQIMDRRGRHLSSGGDTDLALAVCEGGWKRGVFKGLFIRHLIPKERLTEEYLAELARELLVCGMLLQWFHAPHVPPRRITWWWWIKYACDYATKFGSRWRFYNARKRAQLKARALYEMHAVAGAPNRGAGRDE